MGAARPVFGSHYRVGLQAPSYFNLAPSGYSIGSSKVIVQARTPQRSIVTLISLEAVRKPLLVSRADFREDSDNWSSGENAMTFKRVLFVCVENSCRSQMAEAFARMHGA